MDKRRITELAEGQREYERNYAALERFFKADKQKFQASLIALAHSKEMHPGLRKSGFTPKHIHQVRATFRAVNRRRSLKKSGLVNLDVLFADILLHDTPEDNPNLTSEKMKSWFKGVAKNITKEIIEDSFALNKIRKGVAMRALDYYVELLEKPERILTKLFERTDNLFEISGLPPHKQAECIMETLLLLIVANGMHQRYPKLDPVTHDVKETIWLGITSYLNAVWTMRHMTEIPLIEALDNVGLLQRPLTESNRDRFVAELHLF